MCMYGGTLVITYFFFKKHDSLDSSGGAVLKQLQTLSKENKNINWGRGGFPFKESTIQNKARA